MSLARRGQSRELRGVRWREQVKCGRVHALLVFATASSSAFSAHAEEEPVRVQYSAPDTCPDEAAFVTSVRSRTEHGRFAAPAELARTFEVTLTRASTGFSGRIAFVDSDGQRVARAVSGPSCAEVESSLALILALSIDDRVSASPSAAAPEPSPPDAALGSPPKKEAAPVASVSSSVAPRARPKIPPSTSKALFVDVGLNTQMEGWVMPDLTPAFGAFVGLGALDSGWRVRLSLFDARQTVVRTLGEAHFESDFARAELCPFALASGSGFVLTPCAAFDGGVLRVSSGGSPSVGMIGERTRAWIVALLLLRAEWELGTRLAFDADGELGAPFVRGKYQFSDAFGQMQDLFAVPALGAGVKVGVAVRFP